MRKMNACLLLVVLASAGSAQSDRVDEIDLWVQEVNGRIEEWDLLERTMSFTHGTIPAIGMPHNDVTGWFDQIYYEDDYMGFEEVPYYIENRYQHTGVGGWEEYYFLPDGELVCCISGRGGYYEGEEQAWNRFYFEDGEFIYLVTESGEFSDNFGEEILQRAQSRLNQGKQLYDMFMSPLIPVPCIFWEEW